MADPVLLYCSRSTAGERIRCWLIGDDEINEYENGPAYSLNHGELDWWSFESHFDGGIPDWSSYNEVATHEQLVERCLSGLKCIMTITALAARGMRSRREHRAISERNALDDLLGTVDDPGAKAFAVRSDVLLSQAVKMSADAFVHCTTAIAEIEAFLATRRASNER